MAMWLFQVFDRLQRHYESSQKDDGSFALSTGGFWACKFVSTRGNASILWASWLVLAFPSKPVHCF